MTKIRITGEKNRIFKALACTALACGLLAGCVDQSGGASGQTGDGSGNPAESPDYRYVTGNCRDL